MNYEEFRKYLTEECVNETIYTDSEGRDILVINMLSAFQMVWQAQQKEQDRCCRIIFSMAGSDNVAQRTVDAIRGEGMTFETYLTIKLVLAAVGVFVALPLCLLWLKYRDKKRSKERRRTVPDIKLYDYQRGPCPEGTRTTCYFTPPKKRKSVLSSIAPWVDAPLIAGFYDGNDNLIGVRFVRRDGTYEDVDMGDKE